MLTLASSSRSWGKGEEDFTPSKSGPSPLASQSLDLDLLLSPGPLTPGSILRRAHLDVFSIPRESNEGGEFSRMGPQESQSPPPSNLPVTGERTKNNPCASVFVECSPLTLHMVSQQNPERGAVFLLSSHCVSPQAPLSPVGVGS